MPIKATNFIRCLTNMTEQETLEKFGNSLSNLTHFDRLVHDAIISLYHVGNRNITSNMIYEVLSGNNPNKHMSAGEKDIILRSVDKLMNTFITFKGNKTALIPAIRI